MSRLANHAPRAGRVRQSAPMAAIIVHGGAGRWDLRDETAGLAGVARAAEAGWRVLAAGGSALDAVVTATVELEDDPVFNAGTGSVLNQEGEVEMDACLMSGATLSAGGVTCIRRVRNPILVARRVMEITDCVLLACEAATAFARQNGFADHDPITEASRAQWAKALRGAPAAAAQGRGDTVGAVAIDDTGRLAAATSTGGRELKRAGRVGDSPVPGAGNYADAHAAVSATGWGELMLRYATAKAIAERIGHGADAQIALNGVLVDMRRRFGTPVGAIALDTRGTIGIAHGTASMPHALRRSGDAAVSARLRLREG